MASDKRAPRSRNLQPAKVRQARTIKHEERQKYYDCRQAGMGKLASASEAHVDPKTAKKWEDLWNETGNEPFDNPNSTAPKKDLSLNPDARRGRKEFNYFIERYLGRVSLPWQESVSQQLALLSRSPEKEFAVVNLAPGSGKSTLITHDFLCWRIANDRGIRICVLSSTQNNAEKFADRIRRTLEATTPIKAPEKELRLGIAKDATTTLAKDFGRFKPEDAKTWTKKKFFVDRPSTDESHKDATVEAYGIDQAFLGGRYDIVVCDDVWVAEKTRTKEAKDDLKRWFATTAESRLEPSGLMILVMQRVDPEDLSRFALDMEAYDASEDEFVDQKELKEIEKEKQRLGIPPKPVRDGITRKYHHFLYRAHYEDECKGPEGHRVSSPPYPEGCLLYPRRLTYGELKTIEKRDPGLFKIWYQQEDIDLANVLVDPMWIKGGKDDFGIDRQGCEDKDRSIRERPHGLTNDIFSFMTVDPSPSQYWAIQWWAFHKPSNELFLIDTLRSRMASNQFFDLNPNTFEATGTLVEWIREAKDIGLPITTLVAEVNAAQKFMYDSSAIMQFLKVNSVALMPHTTTAQNKNSQEFGVQTLQGWFRDGRIRLPMRADDYLNSRTHSLKLIDEVTRYRLDGTSAYTDDQVMACWFAIRATEKLYRTNKPLPLYQTPSWMAKPSHLSLVG